MSSPSKVLFVDDEDGILAACHRLLRKESFEVSTCNNPEEALKWVQKDEFAVVVSDHRMPQMEGTVFLEKVRAISPESIRLMLTGYADVHSAIDAINKGSVYRFLTKPWNDEELRLSIRQAVDQYCLKAENQRLQELTLKQNKELEELNQGLERKVEERTAEVVELNRSLKKSLYGTVQVLAEATEIHSPAIGNHARRVAALTEIIGRQLGLSDQALFDLKIAASLHEIGKIGISQEVLDKPETERSSSEHAQFRRHMLNGERIIKGVPYLENVARIIRHYKERFDGSGFPDQLVGSAIPLESRILGVADRFDLALNAHSVFRTSSPEKALQKVKDLCPSFFDPEVVSALAHCLQEGTATECGDAEIEIRLKDLKVGMKISRPIRTVGDVLLFPEKTEITDRLLERLKNFQETDPIAESIFVYRE